MPASTPPEPTVAPEPSSVASGYSGPGTPEEPRAGDPDGIDAAGRVEYLNTVMGEIDAEVRRRRASGDLPAGLEKELDELFLEFSPVGLQGRARLRENLALVDAAAYVDIAVPVESEKKAGVYVKRLMRKSLTWYIGFIIHQVVKFAWAVSRMFHHVVDQIEVLESAVEGLRISELPASAVPLSDPGNAWWSEPALAAVSGIRGRILHADCGDGSLVASLVARGVDAYGVDPAEALVEGAVALGLDVRCEAVIDHLEVVAEEALAGMVLSGSIQWLHPNQRDRLVGLAASRLAVDGVLVIHSATPEAWRWGTSTLVADLAPGFPLHADTWRHVLAEHGLSPTEHHTGGQDRRLDPVPSSNGDATAINAAIDVVNDLLAGPGEYLLVAVRRR
ncbi:MAG: methionine biosynthesis protein MetW [Acidimicrobiales bacterium]